ncbi:glycosyltransferase family 8 protein [Sphingobacterium humi]|nr:glycosyltransferase family 8 protein [Sphingobacterium humi]
MEKQHIIPIVFSFDDNLVMQAGVCISSLLFHAKASTYYSIFILHDDQAKFPKLGELEKLHEFYSNFEISYVNVGETFKDAFQIRGITQATYYRLLIPDVIPQYDTIMYHDVDIIFRSDLADIFLNTAMEDYYVAGVSTPFSDTEEYLQKVIGMTSKEYIAAGNIILNSKKLREDGLVQKFKDLAKENWKYQDMDVLNIACKGRVKYLPPSFCVVGTTSKILQDPKQTYYSKEETAYALKYGIIHYNGPKPWNSWCLNFDIWWEYYRKSPYFNAQYYYQFYASKFNELDELSLMKRVKVLVRYFFPRKRGKG